MNRASPVELRKALETARVFATAGFDFVCIPVVNNEDKAALLLDVMRRLEKLEKEAA